MTNNQKQKNRNNNLLTIQEVLMREIRRLDEVNVEECSNEVARSNAITNSSVTFIKSINTQLRIKEVTNKYGTTRSAINKELGVEFE